MGDPQVNKRYTLAEYLELEEAAEFRSEFYNGEIYAMSGGSPEHSGIAYNFSRALGNALDGKGCRVFQSNLMIQVEQLDAVLYPDASVVCGALDRAPNAPNLVRNPSLILEVLSKSTSKYDRSGKFFKYRMIPSLQTFVLVEQDKPFVTVVHKSEKGTWDFTDYFEMNQVVELASLGIFITMKQIYEWIEF